MKSTVLATYAYDSTGHLRQVSDPRTNLATLYYYNGQGRISQVTPPGLAPWRMEYDALGRLAHVQREGGDTDPTWPIAYDVPIGGSDAPVDLTAAQTAKWGQTTDLPVTGTAIFPASHVPARGGDGAYHPITADWPYGELTYLDINGRPVNRADFGAGAWQFGAARHDAKGNVVWALTADNRAQALTPTADTDPYVAARADTAERAELLATTSTYNADSDLISRQGPTHTVKLNAGTVASARSTIRTTYDEGKPLAGVNYHLATTTVTAPTVVDGTATPDAADRRTVKTGYDPIASGDHSGWELRVPTSITTVLDGAVDITRKTRYDASGRVIESRMPESSGSDAGTTVNWYYTAEASGPEQCRRPAWAGLPCRTEPKAQPGTGKPLSAVEITSYTQMGQPLVTTDTAGSVVRTTTSRYDAAARRVGESTTVTPAAEGGTALPEFTADYDPATGLLTKNSAGQTSISVGYDTFGRALTYTDADANTSTYTYDLDGNIATVADGKGTTTYTYDGVDANGKAERRGLLTRIDVSGVGTMVGAYDADAALIAQIYPGGLTARWRYDNNNALIGLSYAKADTSWLSFTTLPAAAGGVAQARGPGSQQDYTYDNAGRLLKVADLVNGTCITRVYSFTLNSNRSRLDSYKDAGDGRCTTSSTPTSRTYSYDQADRLTSSGYTYDAFGRTAVLPAVDTAGTADLTIGYYANDLVSSMTAGGISRTFAVDPKLRVRTITQAGGSAPGTTVHHYGDDSDRPIWTAEADGGWTRNIDGLTGDLAALQSSTGRVSLQLANPHGDVVATADAATTSGIDNYSEQTEYGIARSSGGNAPRYGWLGSEQRATDPLAGVLLMGARLYNPATGRFLQTDPQKGGSANDYEYAGADPVNNTDLDGQVVLVDDLIIGAVIIGGLLIIAAADHYRRNPPTFAWSQEPGSRPGKNFTPRGKQEVYEKNAAKNGGVNRCEQCNVETVKPKKSSTGVTPPKNESQIDHKHPKSKNGSGTPENGQVLCRVCNRNKSNKTPTMKSTSTTRSSKNRNTSPNSHQQRAV
ncbi:RHS repeat-associated core domain-containing protein [Nonomuraea sp. NPDC003727]